MYAFVLVFRFTHDDIHVQSDMELAFEFVIYFKEFNEALIRLDTL